MRSRTVDELNKVLGRALGWCPLESEGALFEWVWSEDLMWPASATGRMVTSPVTVPIIGGGVEFADVLVPEYKARKQTDKYTNQWLVAKWCAPETLTRWETNFPGAPYPARGFRIHTNAALAPFCEPTLSDTDAFIECMKEQRSMTIAERLRDMEADKDRKDAAVDNEIYDEIRDIVPAFANYQPGKKGGYVSLPYTKFDRS